MTNEYKKNILDYITNNVNEQSGNNVPLFDDTEDLNYSVSKTIKELLNNQSYVYYGYLFDENTQLITIYGSYGTNQDFGFIYICDKNLNTKQMITKFVSGSYLFPIHDLRKDEDNKIYGLTRNYDKKIRVILLNDFFVSVNNEHKVILRNSYIVPNYLNYSTKDRSIFFHQKYKTILKVPGEATYFIALTNTTTQTGYIIRFTINVGEDNEWVEINTEKNIYADDMLVEKNGNNIKLHYYMTYDIYDGNNEYSVFKEYLIENDTLSTIKTMNIDIMVEFVFAKNLNEIYLSGLDNANYHAVFGKINGNNINILFDSLGYFINLENANGVMCFYFRNTNTDYSYVGILQNDILYSSTPISDDGYGLANIVCYSFNLLTLYISTNRGENATTVKYTFDYNPFNYNGLPYSNYNQTKAVKGRLYSNGEMVFARNLYNATILNSTSTYTLNVPNTLLNDTEIDIENLIGATNGTLVSNTLTITKNIYENLYINFINTLNVEDEDTDTIYQTTANYITQNINVGSKENCQNTFVGKVRINYENSQRVQNVVWTWNSDHYETEFMIDATQEVPTLDFISNDESTVYITKELNISTGNYYIINQKLRIE